MNKSDVMVSSSSFGRKKKKKKKKKLSRQPQVTNKSRESLERLIERD